jgi:hypothetical protein
MLTGQNTLEQRQEKYMADEHLFNNDNPIWHSPLCAWCLSEHGIPPGEGSHGICKKHANWLLRQQRKLRSRRITTTA